MQAEVSTPAAAAAARAAEVQEELLQIPMAPPGDLGEFREGLHLPVIPPPPPPLLSSAIQMVLAMLASEALADKAATATVLIAIGDMQLSSSHSETYDGRGDKLAPVVPSTALRGDRIAGRHAPGPSNALEPSVAAGSAAAAAAAAGLAADAAGAAAAALVARPSGAPLLDSPAATASLLAAAVGAMSAGAAFESSSEYSWHGAPKPDDAEADESPSCTGAAALTSFSGSVAAAAAVLKACAASTAVPPRIGDIGSKCSMLSSLLLQLNISERAPCILLLQVS